jgi:hypothetical protein
MDDLQVLDPAVRLRGLQLPASARALVLVVQFDSRSQQQHGHRFVLDVLHANGLGTLAVTLHPTEDQRLGQPAPGMVQIKHRLRAVFDWLAAQPAASGLPIALLGVGDAVRGCIAAAVRFRLPGLRTLVLLDGRPYQSAQLLARLSQPTMMVVGACDARTLNLHRGALRQISAPSRLDLLPMATRPVAAPGAHQAIAHATMDWLKKTLWPQDAHVRGGLQPVVGSGAAAHGNRAAGVLR